MRNLILLLFFILSASSYGQLKEVEKQDISNEINLLKNGGFENGLIGWTKSGSSTLTKDLSTPLIGKASAIWDPSAASETLVSDLQVVPAGMYNRNTCSIQGLYQWDSGVQDDLEIQAYDGSSVIATYKPSPTTGSARPISFPFFTCPSSGSIQIRWVSAADASAIKLDGMFIGAGRNSSWAVPKNQFETKILSASVTLNTTLGDLTFSGLEIGAVYELNAQVVLVTDSGATDDDVRLTAYNGATVLGSSRQLIREATDTNSDQLHYSIVSKFVATDTTVTFVSTLASAASFIFGDNTLSGTYAQLEKRNDLGGNFQEGLTLETSGGILKATHGIDCDFVRTNAALGLPTGDATCTFNVGQQAGVFSGATSSLESANNSSGIIFNSNRMSNALVCVSSSMEEDALSASNLDVALYSVNTTEVLASGIYRFSPDTARKSQVSLCGIMPLLVGQNEVQLLIAASGGGTANLRASASSTINWNLVVLDNQFPTPVFTDLQNSLNTKIEGNGDNLKIVSADLAIGAGTCTSNSEYSSWIQSCSKGGTGITTVTFNPGLFSATPVCMTNTAAVSEATSNVSSINGTTSFQFKTYNAAGTLSDIRTLVYCFGPK